MKYRGHETFSIRKNWLAKGILAVTENKMIFTDKSQNPMDALGIGRNMVLSLRYWLKAVGLTEEKRNSETKKTETVLTNFGKIVFENDKLCEETGTLWLLHYFLATNFENATSWYFFFNEFNLSEFSKDDFVLALQNFDRINGGKTAIRSLEDDFECILNTYISRFKTSEEINPEDNIECPFAELGLLDFVDKNKKNYRKIIPPKQNIPSLIFLAVLYDRIEKDSRVKPHNDIKNIDFFEIPLSDIQNKKCFPGKIFNLDTITLMDILSELENKNLIKVVRTAGLDVVQISSEKKFSSCINDYYAELKK